MAAATPITSAVPRGLGRWLDSMPHPPLACEIAPGYVAAARGWQSVYEPLPDGAVAPSPVELNLPDPGAVRAKMQAVLNRLGAQGPDVALLLPDQVIRVFLLHFDTFPRRADEAIPLLRWRLKKSVPFEIDETVVSYMHQPLAPGQASGVSVMAAVARQRVVRQYEEVAEALNLRPGVVTGSTLAALPLVSGDRAVLLARMSGRTLTTMVVRSETLCVFRCTDVAESVATVGTSAVMEELYPAVAFFQDRWRENIAEARLAGFGARFDDFRRAIETDLVARALPLLSGGAAGVPAEGKPLVDRQLDALAGWAVGGSA